MSITQRNETNQMCSNDQCRSSIYNATNPPPGLTWVDLVFPFFLFSMGVAFPLALSQRIAKADSRLDVSLHILKRGVLLGFFAIYIQHVKPHVLSNSPTVSTYLIALLGFVLLAPIYTRVPSDIGSRQRIGIRVIGWVLIVVFLGLLQYPDPAHSKFWLGRSDIIIIVLANVSVSGAFIWWATRQQVSFRVLAIIGLIGLRLGHPVEGWIKFVWDWSPAPWIYSLYYHQYLLIVLPGTIVGDLLLQQFCAKSKPIAPLRHWPAWHVGGILVFCLAMIVWVCIGMYERWVVVTPVLVVFCCGLVCLVWRPRDDGPDAFVRSLFGWGSAWLIVGMLFEPYEGGIKKDSPTLSYYFVTGGLAIYALVVLSIAIERFEWGRRLGLLTANGQNPMVAYAGITNLLAPLLAICGINKLCRIYLYEPWLGFVGACGKTFLLAMMVAWLARRKVVWRT